MSELSRWTRQTLGRPARPSERERWLTKVWLDVQAGKRQVQAELAEQQRLRELPKKQAELVDRYQAMDRDPFTQRIRAEAARQEARRQAALDRQVARVRDEKEAEERAKVALRDEFGYEADTRAMPDAERRALEILRAEYGWK